MLMQADVYRLGGDDLQLYTMLMRFARYGALDGYGSRRFSSPCLRYASSDEILASMSGMWLSVHLHVCPVCTWGGEETARGLEWGRGVLAAAFRRNRVGGASPTDQLTLSALGG
jgi:hypothetical protein